MMAQFGMCPVAVKAGVSKVGHRDLWYWWIEIGGEIVAQYGNYETEGEAQADADRVLAGIAANAVAAAQKARV